MIFKLLTLIGRVCITAKVTVCNKTSAARVYHVFCGNAPIRAYESIDDVMVDVLVFPNPSIGIFIVDFGTTEITKAVVRIMDVEGRILMEESINDESLIEKSYDISSFENGVYLMTITSNTETKSIRLVKQR